MFGLLLSLLVILNICKYLSVQVIIDVDHNYHLQYLSKVIDPTAKGTCEENVRIEFVAYSVQNQWLMRRGKGFPYRMMQQLSYISAGCNP